jgi:hypothetical protein
MEKVNFGLTGMAWNGGSRFQPYISGLPHKVKLGEAKIIFEKGTRKKKKKKKQTKNSFLIKMSNFLFKSWPKFVKQFVKKFSKIFSKI